VLKEKETQVIMKHTFRIIVKETYGIKLARIITKRNMKRSMEGSMDIVTFG